MRCLGPLNTDRRSPPSPSQFNASQAPSSFRVATERARSPEPVITRVAGPISKKILCVNPAVICKKLAYCAPRTEQATVNISMSTHVSEQPRGIVGASPAFHFEMFRSSVPISNRRFLPEHRNDEASMTDARSSWCPGLSKERGLVHCIFPSSTSIACRS
jgi:hypothetical protein